MTRTVKSSIAGLIGGALVGLVLTVGGAAHACGGKTECAQHECSGSCDFHSKKHGKRFSPEMIEKRVAKMKERLSLTDSQTATIQTTLKNAGAKHKAMRDQPKSPAKFKAMQALRFDTKDKVHATLTCEQREEFRKMKREHKSKRMKHAAKN